MSWGLLPIKALGAVTAPTTVVRLGTPGTISTGHAPYGAYDAVQIPSVGAVAFCHGVEAMRYAIDGNSLRIGLLPPTTGMTATPSAAKATIVLDFVGSNQPQNNDYFAVVNNDTLGVGVGYVQVKFVTSLTSTFDGNFNNVEIKIGSNLAQTISRLQGFVNKNSGTEGTDFHWRNSSYPASVALSDPGFNIEVSATAAHTVTFQSKIAGAGPNSWYGIIYADSGGTPWTLGGSSTLSTVIHFSGGVTGTGTAPSTGTFLHALAYYRSADFAMSGIALDANGDVVTTTQDSEGQIALAAFPALIAKDGTDYWRWFRTQAGGDVLFKGKDTASNSSTDDVSDETLDEDGRFEYDETIYRPRLAGYPQVGKCGAFWRGRFWTGGADLAATYLSGTLTATNGSDTVTVATLARPKRDMIGRILRMASTTEDCLIVDVDEATPTITLSKAYEGATVTSAYTITDARNSFLLNYSEIQAAGATINDFPPANSITGVTSEDQSGITGLAVSAWDTLLVFTKTGVWQVTGNTGAFRLQNLGEGCGCFSPQAIQLADTAAYWLGPDGVFRLASASTPTNLSKPRTGQPDGIQATIDAINGDESAMVCSNYNPSSHKIRWWFATGDSPYNDNCLRLDLQTGGFALQQATSITSAATIPGPSGSQVTVLGDMAGDIFQADVGYSDGAYGAEPKCVVSSYAASTRTLSITGTTLPTTGDGWSGVPVVIISGLTGEYQTAKVASNTSGAAVLVSPITAPVAGDVVIFGCYVYDLATVICDWEQPELLKWIEAATVGHEAETVGTEVYMASAADGGDLATFAPRQGATADYADMTDTDGEKHFWLYTPRGRSQQFGLRAFVRGYPVRIRNIILSMRTPSLAEVEG